MPNIYLSPSTQEQQVVVTGNNEEYYMNLIADAMVPYLRASGIDFDRNNPEDTVSQIIEHSNSKYRDVHFMLNMGAGVGNLSGLLRGVNVVYYTGSPGGKEAAAIFAENLRTLYPDPNLVIISSDRLNRELRDTDAVALMVALGYRDNPIDAVWLQNNIDNIAKNLVLSLTQYFGIPFVDVPPANSSYRKSNPRAGKNWDS